LLLLIHSLLPVCERMDITLVPRIPSLPLSVLVAVIPGFCAIGFEILSSFPVLPTMAVNDEYTDQLVHKTLEPPQAVRAVHLEGEYAVPVAYGFE